MRVCDLNSLVRKGLTLKVAAEQFQRRGRNESCRHLEEEHSRKREQQIQKPWGVGWGSILACLRNGKEAGVKCKRMKVEHKGHREVTEEQIGWVLARHSKDFVFYHV